YALAFGRMAPSRQPDLRVTPHEGPQCVMSLAYPNPELRSDAVRLRKWSLDDLDCVRAAGTDPRIPEGTTVPARYTEEAGRAFIERCWARNDDGRALVLAIAPATTNTAKGLVYLGPSRVEGQCRLGYWVIPDARRQGLGKEAIRLVSRCVLTDTHVHRLVARVQTHNESSMKLLLNCGFKEEGVLRSWLWIGDDVFDVIQLSLLRSDLA
ncbi:MAG: GNAT family N-acetyltransferase, partial [Actinomycetota bacterium]